MEYLSKQRIVFRSGLLAALLLIPILISCGTAGRLPKASLADTYCTFINGELWVKGMHVAQYFYGSYNNHEAKRDRKLLLTRKELRKLASDSKNPGYTIVPTRLFIGDKGLAKLVIALAKGKHEFDKRQSIKDNEDKKAIARAFLV
jgi:SsrA-binding protein